MLGDFLPYLDDLEVQFKTGVVRKHQSLDSLDSIGEALRVRSAYYIYKALILGFSKAKEGGASTKQLVNEIY